MKMGRTKPLVEPRPGPQAGKSGYPRSQGADNSPRAQGALGLGFEAKPKGKCGAPRAPTTCGLGRRVEVDWTWASLLPHAALESAWLCGPRNLHSYSSIACAILFQFICFPPDFAPLSNLTLALLAPSP